MKILATISMFPVLGFGIGGVLLGVEHHGGSLNWLIGGSIIFSLSFALVASYLIISEVD